MALTPLDIHNKEFHVKLRGYDQDEVNDFLDQIIKDYENTLKENDRLADSLQQNKEKLKYFNDLKDSLNQSIIVAQEAADKVKANSQKEAEIINHEAQKQGQDIIDQANAKAKHIIDEASRKAKKIAIEQSHAPRRGNHQGQSVRGEYSPILAQRRGGKTDTACVLRHFYAKDHALAAGGKGFPRYAGQPGNPCAGERNSVGRKL